MFTTEIHSVQCSFTGVDKYISADENGRVHIGGTIRNFLNKNKITISQFADRVGLTRGGMNHILQQRHINTERLEIISHVANHNFFQYFCEERTEEMQIQDTSAAYEKNPRRSRVVLDIEDGKVVGQHEEDADPIGRILEIQRAQWQALQLAMPNLAERIASDPNFRLEDFDLPSKK